MKLPIFNISTNQTYDYDYCLEHTFTERDLEVVNKFVNISQTYFDNVMAALVIRALMYHDEPDVRAWIERYKPEDYEVEERGDKMGACAHAAIDAGVLTYQDNVVEGLAVVLDPSGTMHISPLVDVYLSRH